MITNIQKIKQYCKVCNRRADFEVTISNKGLPKNFVQCGQRVEEYCTKHLPQEAKVLWNGAIPDMPKQQL